MNVTIQSIHFDADRRLIGFIESKCQKLAQFFENVVDVQVYLRLEKNKSIGNKVVEIKALVPGSSLVATEQCPSFEEATDKAVEQVRRQLLKYKERQSAAA
ncbi:MAG: ribosome-associated translation inhibitor RaiA [Bacteroidia bacterium]|nr:ribosome-associated translation inhibitor RaiA [Bacteroidia bacterium]